MGNDSPANATALVPEGPHDPAEEWTAQDLEDLYHRLALLEDLTTGACTREQYIARLRGTGSSAPADVDNRLRVA